ncbi:hypothetical protein [Deinococcus multiflagellatus]|uniref:Lipoprotein n=1 Tax=Deinococcus multiflagellatus TaxID=1656887 RepID=A0ABW1ZG06_9DEIO|nr:hypothetical protein [Deinococcus multiflagellatus]MBZ9712753.1 hypothetical protein [Deinococcus multiflagellatus]
MRFLLPLALLLTACVPTLSSAPTTWPFRAAFSDLGVAWVSGGRACVARAPSFERSCPALPGAVDVAWAQGDAWAAVPERGLAVTLDRAPRTVNVGRVVALSASRAYREDGSAVDYDGRAAPGVRGAPQAALTSLQGEDFVLLGGQVVRVPGAATGQGPASYLALGPGGVTGTAQPQVQTPGGTYRLTGQALVRLDAAGQVRAQVPHGAGRIGTVGALVVTVSPDGQLRLFDASLQPWPAPR